MVTISSIQYLVGVSILLVNILASAQIISPLNDTFFDTPSPTAATGIGSGHHTRCPFGTFVMERFLSSVNDTIRNDKLNVGDAPARFRPVVINIDDFGNVTAFDGCSNTLGSFSTVLDEQAPSSNLQSPQIISCSERLIVSSREKAAMFSATEIAIQRLKAIIATVPFNPRRQPIIFLPTQQTCRLSSIFPRTLSFKNRSDNLGIIVSAVPMPQKNLDGEFFWKDVLAWAVPCAFDTRGRPLLIRVNFNIIKLRSLLAAGQNDVILSDVFHQLLHAAGFGGPHSGIGSNDVWSKKQVPLWQTIPQGFMLSQYGCNDSSTPFYFDDNEAIPARLRPSDKFVSHFEPRIVSRDVMTSGGHSGRMGISAATLAYFSVKAPYYGLQASWKDIVDPSKAYQLPNDNASAAIFIEKRGIFASLPSANSRYFEHAVTTVQLPLMARTVLPATNYGCGLHGQYCNEKSGGAGTLFCNPVTASARWESNVVCSRNRVGLVGCQLQSYGTERVFMTPFSNGALGGLSPHADFCAYPNGTDFGRVLDEQMYFSCKSYSLLLPERSGSSFGGTSLCFESDLIRSFSTPVPFNARCFIARCYLGITVQVQVNTMDGDHFISCPRDGRAERVQINLPVPTHTGVLQCPDYKEICNSSDLIYLPYAVNFKPIPDAGGYPFEIGIIPSYDSYPRDQAIQICERFNATLVTATDWKILNLVRAEHSRAWVIRQNAFGFPPQTSDNQYPCSIVSSDYQSIQERDCGLEASIACIRQIPPVVTSPCVVGRPCLLTHASNPSLTSFFLIPNGMRRVSSNEAANVCASYGAVPFSTSNEQLPTFLQALKTYFGDDAATIPSLWTSMRSANLQQQLLSPGALDNSCVVISQLSKGAVFTLHSTHCDAEFEVLCMIQDGGSNTNWRSAGDVPFLISDARVPRTFEAANAHCQSAGGGFVAPYFTAAQKAATDEWIRGTTSRYAGDDTFSGRTSTIFPRNYWMGVTQNGYGTPANTPTIRFFPAVSALGGVNGTLLRVSDSALSLKVLPVAGASGYSGLANPTDMQIAFFSCAILQKGPDYFRTTSNMTLRLMYGGTGASGMNYTSTQMACYPTGRSGPLFRTLNGSSIAQPIASDVFGLQGTAFLNANYFSTQIQQAFAVSQNSLLAWTGLVYIPSESTLAIPITNDGTSVSYSRFTTTEMLSIANSYLWPSSATLSDYDATEINAVVKHLCVAFLIPRIGGERAPKFVTVPCGMSLPAVCVEDTMFGADTSHVRGMMSLNASWIRVGSPLAMTVSFPPMNITENSTLGVNLFLGSSGSNSFETVTIRMAAGIPLRPVSSGHVALIEIPTKKGSCSSSSCPPIVYTAGKLVINDEASVIVGANFASNFTSLGASTIDLYRSDPAAGLSLNVYMCPSVQLAMSEPHKLCGIPVSATQRVPLLLSSSGKSETLSLRFSLSNSSSCSAADNSLGTFLFNGASTTSVKTAEGIASTTLNMDLTPQTAYFGAYLCVKISGSCPCCRSFAVSNASFFYDYTSNIFMLTPSKLTASIGGTSAIEGSRLEFVPGVWAKMPSFANATISVFDRGNNAVVSRASIVVPSEGSVPIDVIGERIGDATLTAHAVAPLRPPVAIQTPECYSLRDSTRFFPLVIGDRAADRGRAYSISNATFSFTETLTGNVWMIDRLGHKRSRFYAGEEFTLRIQFIVNWNRAIFRTMLEGIGYELFLALIPPRNLVTLTDQRIDIVQTLLRIDDSAELIVDFPSRALNSSTASSDSVLTDSFKGGFFRSQSPNVYLKEFMYGGIQWELNIAGTTAAIDMSVVFRNPLQISDIPQSVVISIPFTITFTVAQAPPEPLVIIVSCDNYYLSQETVMLPTNLVDVFNDEILQKSIDMIALPSANEAVIRNGSYSPVSTRCYLRYSVSATIVATNTTFILNVFPRIIPIIESKDSTVLYGGSSILNISIPMPSNSLYLPSAIGLNAARNASRGLSSVLVSTVNSQNKRIYTFRVSTESNVVPSSTVCLTFSPINVTLVEPPLPQCYLVAPPLKIVVSPLESFTQPVGDERSRSVELVITSSPITQPVNATLSCETPNGETTNSSIATFVPSNVRWEMGAPITPRRIVMTGKSAGAYCMLKIVIMGGSEVQNAGTHRVFSQAVLFVSTEHILIEPSTPFSKLFPGEANAKRLRVFINRQPSSPIDVQLMSDAPAGMLSFDPPSIHFANVSNDNRTRDVKVTSLYGSADSTVYTIWSQIATTADEFLQRTPKDGIAKTFVRFESERLYNISVVNPSAPTRGHITDTAVYCGDMEAATRLQFVSPHIPISTMDRVFVFVENAASDPSKTAIHLYTNPAVTIFTRETPLQRAFMLACDVSTFPHDEKSVMVPLSLRLEGPPEFGVEGSFFAELRRLESLALSIDPTVTVSSTRIYLDVTLSAPILAGMELHVSLVTSCGSFVSLLGESQQLVFSENDIQRSTRLAATGPAVNGCNVTMVQTSSSKATNFERFSVTKMLFIYPQARITLINEVIPEVITDMVQYLQNRKARAFSIPQLQARNGFKLQFKIESNSLSRSSKLSVERLALGISATTSIAITSNFPNSEYVRTLMANKAVSVRSLPNDPNVPISPTSPTTTLFEVIFDTVPTPTSVGTLSENEEITLIFSRYLLARNDTEPETGFGNYTFIIIPEEVSIVGVQRNAVSAAAIIATLLSPFSGPSLAPHFSRVSVLIDIGSCPTPNWKKKKQSNLEIFTSPIQTEPVGTVDSMATYFMAGVMNLVFILVLVILHLILVAIVFASRINVLSANKSVPAAMQKARFPGASVFAIAYFAGFNSEFGLRTAMHTNEDTYIGLGVLLLAITWIGSAYVFFHVYSRKFLQYERSENAQTVSWYRRIFDARGTWEPLPEALTAALTASDKEKVMCFHDRYGSVFTQFVAPWQYYLSIDVAFSVIIGIIGAFEPADNSECLAKSSALLTVFVLSTIILIAMRPYAYHMYNMFFISISVFEVVSVALSVSAAQNASSGNGGTFGIRAATISMLVVTNMLLLKLAVDVFLLVQSFAFKWLSKRKSEKDVIKVGPQTGLVPYTDFASVSWWSDHFGNVTTANGTTHAADSRQTPLLHPPVPSADLDDVMMCDLDHTNITS